jgi:hypothetical protein
MENGGKFGIISIGFKMVLKKSETLNKFKGKNIMDKSKMHPPLRKSDGKNPFEIVSVKSNKPDMVKIGSLVKEKFGTKHQHNHNNCKKFYKDEELWEHELIL